MFLCVNVPFAFDGVMGTVSFDGGKCELKVLSGALDGWTVTVNGKTDGISIN